MRTRFVGFLSVLFLAFALGAAPVEAQSGTITGTVVNSDTGQPLNGAQIQVRGGGTNTGQLSNDQGRFSITVPAGSYSVDVTYIGYRQWTEDLVRVTAGQPTMLNIQLVSDAVALNPMVVTVGRKEEKKTEAPATTHVVSTVEIEERPAVTPVDHLRSAPGVDIISQGVQSTNVVVRGFNNIFSGSLHALTDNRIAGVPSLRVNLLHFTPQTNEDIERMEVVLGPGSALYGPNTANGVLHILTKSPLDYQGTKVTFGGGEQGVLRGSLWTSHMIGENFGVKVSGQYARGDEWPFVNPDEVAAATFAETNSEQFIQSLLDRGLPLPVAEAAQQRVGRRVNEFERWSLNARADWQYAADGTWIFEYGRTNASGIELTGLGAGQTDGWIYEFYQTRFNKGRLFLQTYLNSSDSGDSYLLNDGVPLVDKSRLFVAQAQYGFSLADDRQDFTMGADYFHTNPRTEGTINGANESIDNIDEFGFYLQSETAVTDWLDLVVAGRLDSHSFLEDDVFSPRAALVFKPDDNSAFRVTYNRAFSPPSTLNLFLDISGGAIPQEQLALLGYKLRAQGPNAGFSFVDGGGNLTGMLSPFTPAAMGGPSQLLPADAATLWALGVGFAQAQGLIDAQTAALLGQLQPTAADIGINVLDGATGAVTPLAVATIPGVPQLSESTNETFELGYQGVINNRFMISADVWYSERNDFVSPLVLRTPFLLLNANPAAGPDMTTWLTGQLVNVGVPQAQAQCQALALTIGDLTCDGIPDAAGQGGLAALPLGVVSSDQVNASAADVLATYVNAGTVDLWGADLAIKYFVDDRWTIDGTFSWVQDDYFADDATATAFGIDVGVENGIAPIALNAPKTKGSLALGYRDVGSGFNAEVRYRYTSEFPAESAGFVGTACISGGNGGALETDCVEAFNLFDVTLGYSFPNMPVRLQVAATNLFDADYRSFVGVPEIGRFLMAELQYTIR